ncbi:heme exporter protein CcmB [Schleiferia thermophila]|jgi:heme exporter protein B|uniref:Heme exporter protein B n=1 Tax=Schleiferia thermophila TaxID=884107 RepID=A0A369A9Y8_9FLAO|nr:heme exporter protein CcmB [Schleiferia thermophila]KFD38640.1 hypothetical protein AT05_09275 [Schleiferia thermophila str. Yellowstone]RCX05208.1 heme exporter protein B [Schleiferia thermophila]GCD79279.1 hypothetical protein JCM30197_05260 [Schleiferia thermophila]
MHTLRQIIRLIAVDLRIEWREKHQLFSLILYITSSVFVAYMLLRNSQSPRVIISVFWIILCFGAITTTSRSLIREASQRFIFYYQTLDSRTLIISKIVVNTLMLSIISIFTAALFSLLFPIDYPIGYLISTSLLGSMAFASTLTLIAGISATVQGNTAIMAILSFPLLLPQLLVLIRISEALALSLSPSRYIISTLLLDVVTVALSLILFHFLWKE